MKEFHDARSAIEYAINSGETVAVNHGAGRYTISIPKAEGECAELRCAAMRKRLAELDVIILEQRRIGVALAARVRRDGGHVSLDDIALLYDADQLFGRDESPKAGRSTR